MGNPEAKAAAKRAKEERRKGKVRIGGKVADASKRYRTSRKRAQGHNGGNTKDPRVT